MSDEFETYGIRLTEKQIVRQVNKLKNILFLDYEELEDGAYKGEVHDEIIKIINEHIGDREEITQNEFLGIVKICATAIFGWVLNKVEGVDERLMALYCFDFANQTLNTMYSITFVDKDDKNDSMYV